METARLFNRSALVQDPRANCVSVAFGHQVHAGFSSPLASACHSCAARASKSSWRPNMGCNVSSITTIPLEVALSELSSYWRAQLCLMRYQKFLQQFLKRNDKRLQLSSWYRSMKLKCIAKIDNNGYTESCWRNWRSYCILVNRSTLRESIWEAEDFWISLHWTSRRSNWHFKYISFVVFIWDSPKHFFVAVRAQSNVRLLSWERMCALDHSHPPCRSHQHQQQSAWTSGPQIEVVIEERGVGHFGDSWPL